MRNYGFTLIELMIVVAIIAIIAAIAIPSLLRARMSANETAAIAACKACAEAQEIYHRTDYNHDGVLEYAQFIHGSSSLIENTTGTSDLNLVDGAVGNAEGDVTLGWKGGGGLIAPPTPKSGYLFAILYMQGSTAPGGQRSYLSNHTYYNPGFLPNGAHLTLGYAISAIPGSYEGTGRNTFVINHNGVIYQSDRGAASSTIHPSLFDPAPNAWACTE